MVSPVTRPWLSYLICSTPRSGSTLLCDAMTNTGIAGRPEEYFQQRKKTGLPRRPREYFEDAETAEIVAILGDVTRVDDEVSAYNSRRFAHYADYLAWTIEEATTPNGVFGAKLMWGYFNGFISYLRQLPGHADLAPAEILPSVFPNLHFVWVTRNDKARQAVSLWKALQTWTWRRDAGDGHVVPGNLQYSFDAIDHLVGSICADEVAWRGYFAEVGVVPHDVVYEDFAQNYEGVVRGIIDFLGIDADDDLHVHPPRMTRQSDELSEEWLARYSADAAVRS
jgi:LPS sulfotransferase NodH